MSRKVLLLAMALFAVLLFVGVVGAQEVSSEDAHAMTKSWWDLFKTTGVVGILLFISSVIGTGLLIQYLMTMNENSLANPQFLAEIEDLIEAGNVDEAFESVSADATYAGKVLTGAMSRSSAGYEEALKGLEETATVEYFKLNSKISYLSLIGNIGPLLGLLGTVTGMISSFQVIETLKAPTPGDLAKGVYESLVNTTIGLFIAIVFLSAYFFLKNKVQELTIRTNNHMAEMLSRWLSPQGSDAQ